MPDPVFYRIPVLAKKWNLTELDILDFVLKGKNLRPSIQKKELGGAYQLCLYDDVVAGTFLPSEGVLRLLHEDGMEVSNSEWCYLQFLDEADAESSARTETIVIQTGKPPKLPRYTSEKKPLPTVPKSYAVCFETFEGEKLSPLFVGNLSAELGGIEVRTPNFRIGRDVEWLFMPAEVERFDALASEGDSDQAVETIKPISRPQALQQTILNTLQALGYNPECLPTSKSGTSGVRKIVRKKIESTQHVTGATYKKAWQTLLDNKSIRSAD